MPLIISKKNDNDTDKFELLIKDNISLKNANKKLQTDLEDLRNKF